MKKLTLILALFLLNTKKTFAALPVIGTVDKAKVGAIDLNTLIRNGVLLVLALGGLIFFAMLLLGGMKYLSSAGDEKAAASARGTLTNAFVGLLIIMAAFLISAIIFQLFELPGISITGS